MQIKTAGIVLKQRNVGENDRIITILSKDLGLIEASAKNVKTTKSSLGGAIQILSYTDFCLFKGKGLYIVNSAEIINSFYDLRLDVINLSLAGYFCELTAHLCASDDEHAEDFLKLLLNTLHFLQNGSRDAGTLKSIFELRAISIAGFMPNIVCCFECATYEAEEMFFLPVEGLLYCSDCMTAAQSNQIYFPLSNDLLSAMRFIIFSEIERVFNFRLTGISAMQLAIITESYVDLHTETKFKSLEMYKSLSAIIE